MESFFDGIKRALFRPINKAAISIMATFTLIWGFWVGNPMWTVFTTAPLFNAMSVLAPEWVWGTVALIVGLVMLFGVIRMSYRSLILGASTGFYFWICASIAFFLGDWQNTGGITLLMIALYCGYIALNLRMNKVEFVESEVQFGIEKE